MGELAEPRAVASLPMAMAEWNGCRKEDFEPLLKAMNEARGERGKMTGRGFLRYLCQCCAEEAARGRGTLVHENAIVEFNIDIETAGGERKVRVWRLIAESGVTFLRMAPKDDPGAREMLIESMLRGATRSTTRKRGTDWVINQALLPYDPETAKTDWRVVKEEFDGLRMKRNRAIGRQRGRAEFLRYISALCDKQIEISRYRQIDPEGWVLEFEIEIEGEGKVKVWRLVDEVGGIMLRLAPPKSRDKNPPQEAGALRAEEEALLKHMLDAMNLRDGRKRKRAEAIGPAILPLDAKHAQAIWQICGKDFKAEYARWHGLRKVRGGAAFVQHMSALCDQQHALERVSQVDEDGYIFKFTIEIEGTGDIEVWRLLDHKGKIDLRRAPTLQEHGDSYQEACKELCRDMLERMAKSYWAEAGTQLTLLSREQAGMMWRANCMRHLDPYFEQWNRACGMNKLNGAIFLRHISCLCNQQDLLKRSKPIEPKSDIQEYRICLYLRGPELSIWRLIARPGVELMRVPPAPPHDPDDKDAVANYESEKRALISEMQKTATISRRARRV